VVLIFSKEKTITLLKIFAIKHQKIFMQLLYMKVYC